MSEAEDSPGYHPHRYGLPGTAGLEARESLIHCRGIEQNLICVGWVTVHERLPGDLWLNDPKCWPEVTFWGHLHLITDVHINVRP